MKSISEIFTLIEYHFIWPSLYSIFKVTEKQDMKTVLFADPYSYELTDNMKPIYAVLEKRGGFKLLTCFPKKTAQRTQSTSKASAIFKKIANRFSRSYSAVHFLKLYASCGTLILTESYLPAYAVKPRCGTQIVQLWHGCGAFKKWGYSTLDKSFGATRETAELFPMHNCYTLVPVSSAEVTHAYAEAFNCQTEIIKPLGVPRTDIYFDKEFVDGAKDRLYESCIAIKAHIDAKAMKEKTIVLYAPTFRGNNISNASCDIPIDFKELSTKLEDNFIFLCKLHPFAKTTLSIPKECESFVFDISDSQTDTALCAADILVTDYSSVIFEYSLLSRPMIFYAYDLEEYIAERDFYYEYESFIPGTAVTTQLELEIALRGASANFNARRIDEFRSKFMSACDGNASKRIASHLFD